MTSRGLKESDFERIGEIIASALKIVRMKKYLKI